AITRKVANCRGHGLAQKPRPICGRQSQFGRRPNYGKDDPHTTPMSPAMNRSALLFVALLACALAAGAARAQESDADLVTRINRLEAVIRQLTGNIEQLQYRNQQLEQQLQRLQADAQPHGDGVRPQSSVPQRPTAQYSPPPYSSPAGASPPVVAAAPPVAPIESPPPANRRGDAFDPALNPNAPGAPRPMGTTTAATEPPPIPDAPAPGPRQLGAPLDLSTLNRPQGGAAPTGDLPAPPPSNPSATGALQATLPPGNTPRDEYDLGYGYVLHKDYALAANTFRNFLRQYPSDRLAPEAKYWLGESLFQQQQYRDAAES